MKSPWLSLTVILAAALSLALHILSVSGLSSGFGERQPPAKPVKVKIIEAKVEEKKPEPTPTPPPPTPTPLPPKPTPKPKAKPTPKPKVATERPKAPAVANQPPPKPVQGLDANSMSPNGKGIAVPMGNSLMVPDSGVRVKEAPPPMDADLSTDAKLIHESISKPQYTDAALDANLEGTVVVDVFVDESGKVSDAELKKTVGYGMDERILAAAKAAHFSPRKNKLGRPESGWTEIRFSLQIP